MKLTDDQIRLLTEVVDYFENEDKSVRQNQVMKWRQFKLLWDGFTQFYWDYVAHDWRIYDSEEDLSSSTDQSYYDKQVNVFKSYIETIIAALSVTVPGVKCFPDDAENPNDLATAKAGDRIAKLIYKHNDFPLKWLQALFINCTEGMVAAYSYSKADKKYGVYKERRNEQVTENYDNQTCPDCGSVISDTKYDGDKPPDLDIQYCAQCKKDVIPLREMYTETAFRLTGITETPKSRQQLELYGGLYVKVPSWARTQEDCPYLFQSYETHYTNARATYSNDRELRDKIISGNAGSDEYDRYARLPNEYNGSYPDDNVTIRNRWLRPSAFEYLHYDDCKELKKLFPDGVKAVYVNDLFCEAIPENLDECWTLMYNPLSDHLHFEPLANDLVSLQEITVDLISLILQTIEHGISQMFVDPQIIDFEQYKKTEITPGSIFPTKARSNRPLQELFYETRTATLAAEVLPFSQQIQSYAQLVSGALPSLFGGELEGSKTASQYSMSRAQGLQRQQNKWKILISWWKRIYDKMILKYMKDMKDDERLVEKNSFGGFVNTFIRKSDLSGTIGSVELDVTENLPMNWLQRKDAVMNLIQLNNQEILQFLFSPENLPLIKEAIGLDDFVMPTDEDIAAEHEEIQLLLSSAPIEEPPDEMMLQEAILAGQPPDNVPGIERPSVEIDMDFDNHAVRFEVDRRWIIGDAGRLAKQENDPGYRNVLLHAMQHKQAMEQIAAMQAQQQAASQGTAEPNNQQKEPVNV